MVRTGLSFIYNSDNHKHDNNATNSTDNIKTLILIPEQSWLATPLGCVFFSMDKQQHKTSLILFSELI